MIDLHNHLLPEIDNGSKNLEESLKMAVLAERDGISIVTATPHYYEYSFDEIRIRSVNLEAKIKELGLKIKIIPGAEIPISSNLDPLKVPTFGGYGRYALLELPFGALPLDFVKVVYKFKEAGVGVVLAHPERNIDVINNPCILKETVDLGALVQINALSLQGKCGEDVQKAATILLKEGLVHIMASDAHSSLSRPPILSLGLKIAVSIIGEKEASLLVKDNPEKVISPEEELT